MLKFAATAALTALAGQAIAESTTINGATLHHETTGQGAPVLVMHGGLGLDHTYLRPWFDKTEGEVVYYDHFGNGRSERPDDYSQMTFERLVDDAADLMTELGHETFVLIGHSYGGFVAQEFAKTHADRLRGLVLVSTVPKFDYQPTISGPDDQMAAFGKLFTQPMADDADFRQTWTQVVQLYFRDYDPELGAKMDAATAYSGAAWNASGPMLATFDTTEALAKLDVPTLAVSGRHDGITPPGPGAERIGTLVPGATTVIFEDSAHYPFIAEETAFFETLNSWLSELD